MSLFCSVYLRLTDETRPAAALTVAEGMGSDGCASEGEAVQVGVIDSWCGVSPREAGFGGARRRYAASGGLPLSFRW